MPSGKSIDDLGPSKGKKEGSPLKNIFWFCLNFSLPSNLVLKNMTGDEVS